MMSLTEIKCVLEIAVLSSGICGNNFVSGWNQTIHYAKLKALILFVNMSPQAAFCFYASCFFFFKCILTVNCSITHQVKAPSVDQVFQMAVISTLLRK